LRVELESREARTVLIAHLNLVRLGDLVLAQNKRDQNTTHTAYIHNRRMIFAVLCRRCKVKAEHVTLLPSTLSMDYQQNVSNQTCLAYAASGSLQGARQNGQDTHEPPLPLQPRQISSYLDFGIDGMPSHGSIALAFPNFTSVVNIAHVT
jgi:hypothetical protein